MKNPILGIENLYLGALFNGILIFKKILNWNFKIWILDFLCYFFWLTSEDGMNEPSYEDVRHDFGTPKSHTFSLWKSQEHPCHLRQHFVNICWPQCGPKCAEICVLGAHLTTCSSWVWVLMTNIFSELKNMNHQLSNAPSTMFLRHLVMFLHFETYALANPQKAAEFPKSGCQLDFLPHIYNGADADMF